MKYLIFTPDLADRSLATDFTAQALQNADQHASVEFSKDFDLSNMQSDSGFALVVPGGFLGVTWSEMKDSNAMHNCTHEVNDHGAHFLGFCAGAYLAGSSTSPGKNRENPFYEFSYSTFLQVKRFNGGTLNLLEDLASIGPFLPDNQLPEKPHSLNSHLVKLYDHTEKTVFDSLYMEGPLFLSNDYKHLYNNQDKISASFSLPENIQPIKMNLTHEVLTLNPQKDEIPAVIHAQQKNSHRVLFSAHVELASVAKGFLTAYNANQNSMLVPVKDSVVETLSKPENETANRDFLKKVLHSLSN